MLKRFYLLGLGFSLLTAPAKGEVFSWLMSQDQLDRERYLPTEVQAWSEKEKSQADLIRAIEVLTQIIDTGNPHLTPAFYDLYGQSLDHLEEAIRLESTLPGFYGTPHLKNQLLDELKYRVEMLDPHLLLRSGARDDRGREQYLQDRMRAKAIQERYNPFIQPTALSGE